MTNETLRDVCFPYQDASLSIEQRVEDLLAHMDVADKAGMLFHTMVSFGDPAVGNPVFGLPSAVAMAEAP